MSDFNERFLPKRAQPDDPDDIIEFCREVERYERQLSVLDLLLFASKALLVSMIVWFIGSALGWWPL